MWRELFSYSLNPEIYFDADNLWRIIGCKSSTANETSRRKSVAETRQASEHRWHVLASRTTEGQRLTASIYIMGQSAPMAATLGATVHNLSAPGVFEVPAQLSAMALLADDAGGGAAHRSRADAFRAIARRHSAELGYLPPHDLSRERRLNEQVFRLPGALLALSRRSDRFSLELLGADLALREFGCLMPWRFAAEALPSREWSRLDMALAQTPDCLAKDETPLALSRSITRAVAPEPSLTTRVDCGRGLFLELYEEWDRTLHDLTVARLDSRLSMALLLQSKAREASVYHEGFNLDGRTLRDWFAEARTDPLPLLDALSKSRRLVCPGMPDRSPIATQMLAYGGPMFRVFKDNDIKIIRDWIADLGREDTWFLPESRADVLGRLSSAFEQPRAAVGRGVPTVGITPASIREAYFVLQGRALAPATRAFAADYCNFWLAKAEACVDKTERSLPSNWQPGLMREWLLEAHARQANRFEKSREETLPSREAVIDQSLQLAPLTLIDGAWLQGYTDVTLAATRTGAPLFKIYWDELGNGSLPRNHPRVYRDVLAAMGKELPPTGSLDFAFHAEFKSESFGLPVFWLAVGKFPLRYRAEILGLNLAMELSGVGGSYRAAQHFLRHHGFPTIFVDLHNTIDNVSDGHAAWAVDAIDAHISAIEDCDEAASIWTRVRRGYEALEPIISICGSLDYFQTHSSPQNSKRTSSEALHHAS